MKKIGLAVETEFKDVTVEDKLLAERLRNLGFDASPVIWDAGDASNVDFDAVLVQSCWGYHRQPRKFLEWIAKLETNGIMIFNSPTIIRWNLDKIYLRKLAEKGVKIPRTVWFEQGERADLSNIIEENGWQKSVLKPRISATAWRTLIVTPENAAELQPEFESLLKTGGVIMQEFVEEIISEGELSFVFFDKIFSHAVLKRAKAGDFRVQDNFGGTVEAVIEPPGAFVETARKIVSAVAGDLLYARVDAVNVAGELSLMELELIEPVLFLEKNEPALQTFAETIIRRFE